jgi:predicted nucleic acid-binding protein
MERLATVPMTVLRVDVQILVEAMQLAVRNGLLTNDSAILALMRRHGLTHLASNDDDFNRIPDLTVWKPR